MTDPQTPARCKHCATSIEWKREGYWVHVDTRLVSCRDLPKAIATPTIR